MSRTGSHGWGTSRFRQMGAALGLTAMAMVLVASLTNAAPVLEKTAVTQGSGSAANFMLATQANVSPPDAPSLVMTADDLDLVASWSVPANNGADITGYWLRHRRWETDDWTEVGLNGTATSYTISTAMVSHALYEFQVRAENSAGEGAWSNMVIATPPPYDGTPNPPVLSLSTRSGKIEAQWTKPAHSGDHDPDDPDHINSYRLQHRVKGSSGWTTITINPDNLSDLPDPPVPGQPYPPIWWVPNVPTSHSIDGLANATTRQVRVRASNDSGLGSWSEVIEARPGESQAPTAPRQLTLSAGITTIRANWVQLGNDRGSAVTDYDVEYRETGSTSWTDVPHTTGTKRTITGLTNGKTYDVRVRAENTTGNDAWLAQTVTLPLVEPGVQLLETTMTVGVVGGLAGYSRHGNRQFGELGDNTFSLDGTDYTITELLTYGDDICFRSVPQVGVTDMAQVRLTVGTWIYHGGWRQAGGGDICRSKDDLTLEDGDSVSVRLEEIEPSAPGPSDLVITPGDKQLTVALPDDLPFTLKQVRASAFGSHKDVPMTGNSITLTGLHNCKVHNVHVRFTLANGNVVVLPDVEGTLGMPNGTELVPPRQPILERYNSQMGVYWGSGFASGCGITYDLDYSLWDDPWNSEPAVTGLTASYVLVTGLTNGMSYKFRVRAVRDGVATGWSPMSYSVPGTGSCNVYQIPCPPGNIHVVGAPTAGNTQVALSWTNPSFGGGQAGAAGSNAVTYDVEVTVEGYEWNLVTGITGTSTTVGGLINGGEYGFRVRARNVAGPGQWSQTVQATPAVPDTPSLTNPITDANIAEGTTVTIDMGDHFSGDNLSYSAKVTTMNQRTGQSRTGDLNSIARNKVTGEWNGSVLTLTAGSAIPQDVTISITATDGDGNSASGGFTFSLTS